jgi:hypothetical protein
LQQEEEMVKVALYLPYISIIISLISLWLAWRSYNRTKVFQEYEYAPRLQITEREQIFGSQSHRATPAFRYAASIANRGHKAIELTRIYLDYGDADDPEKRMKRVVEGEMYVSSGDSHEIEVNVPWPDIEAMKDRFNIDQAMFFLRVSYKQPNGTVMETTRPLGGFDGETMVAVVTRGDRLT